MRKTFKFFCAVAVALLAVSSCGKIWDEFDNVHGELDSLKDRIEKLEKALQSDVDNLTALQNKVNSLETSFAKAVADGDAAVKKALEDALAKVKADLQKAITDGDEANAAALEAEVAKIEDAIANLKKAMEDGLAGVTASVKNLSTALAALEATVGANYKDILAKMDAADKVLDGKIADVAAAVEAVKKAYPAADKEVLAAFAEALAKVAVQKVEEVDGNVVLTLADGSKITLAKPAAPLTNVDNSGLVTIVTEDGVKYWGVVKADGTSESLGIPVGADTSLEFRVGEGNALEYSLNGGDWIPTGAYVADSEYTLLTDFYQGDTDEIDWETYEYVKEDFYTLVFGGTEYHLPLYKVDESVVTLKTGKTYFEYGESVTVDVVISDIASVYVMTKPDGWRASLEGKKLTVTAPVESAVEAGYAESDGEVLLHATTAEGKCKIVKFVVATTPGFSLTLSEDGVLTIVNPEVVTMTDRWGDVSTDFNDAYVGLAEVAAFEADPIAYVEGIQDNWDALYTYLANWKSNTVEYDDDWNPIYKIGGMYEPGVYEVDVIETTVPEMYADWNWGEEIPAQPYVVWACPMDENGMPKTADLVYAYYYPEIKATITEVAASTTDVEVAVNVVGATTYYVGLVAEEQLYGFPIDEYMQMQEGPFGYFQMALQYGMPDYAFQQMGTQFGGEYGEEMPETITASMIHYGQPLMPSTKFYMWVFPVVDGLDLADYTYEKNLKPYIYEFTTEGLAPGGSATVEFGDAELTFSSMTVGLSATEGSSMIYYQWFEADEFNELDEDTLAETLMAEGFVIAGEAGEARNSELTVTPGSEFVLAALAIDAEGKYGEVAIDTFTAPELKFSETFKASFGQYESSVYYSGYRYNFPINVEGGEAAKYYYTWSTTEYTDEQLANLPLSHEYDYNFRSTTNVSAGQLAGQYGNAETTYYLAVVVESTTGELSPVIKMTVEIPAVPEE